MTERRAAASRTKPFFVVRHSDLKVVEAMLSQPVNKAGKYWIDGTGRFFAEGCDCFASLPDAVAYADRTKVIRSKLAGYSNG